MRKRKIKKLLTKPTAYDILDELSKNGKRNLLLKQKNKKVLDNMPCM